jgi:hypothetical protein
VAGDVVGLVHALGYGRGGDRRPRLECDGHNAAILRPDVFRAVILLSIHTEHALKARSGRQKQYAGAYPSVLAAVRSICRRVLVVFNTST